MSIVWDDDEPAHDSEILVEVEDAREAAIEAAIQLAMLRWRALKAEYGLD